MNPASRPFATYRWAAAIALLGLLLSALAYRAGRESLAVLISGLLLTTLISLFLGLMTRQSNRQAALSKRLEESETRFRQLAEIIDAVFWIGSPDWRQVFYISPAYEQIWGRGSESLYARGMDWFDAVLEEDRPALREKLPSEADEDWQTIEFPPYRIRRPDGEIRWISARAFPIRDQTGKLLRVAGIAEDITERQAYQRHLEDLAHYDPLTHLPNRRLLADRMRQALAHGQRTGQLLAICMLDLDGFKPVNDDHGHHVGDLLLQAIAARLKNLVREGDTVARLGGDEFAVILGDSAELPAEALAVAARLGEALREEYALSPGDGARLRIRVGASIGISLSPDHAGGSDPRESMIRAADKAMYLAKHGGKGATMVASSEA